MKPPPKVISVPHIYLNNIHTYNTDIIIWEEIEF